MGQSKSAKLHFAKNDNQFMADLPVETAAKKVLGNSAKLPKPRTDPVAVTQNVNKLIKEFSDSVKGVGDKLLAVENAVDAYKNTMNQYKDIVDGSNFGLNENNKDDQKKIESARAIYHKEFQAKLKDATEFSGELKKLDKILTDLRRLDKIKI